MGRRKGELTKHTIDRQWPHQVAVPNSRTMIDYWAMDAFCKGKNHSPTGHAYYEGGECQVVFCFGREEEAQAFAGRKNHRSEDAAKMAREWPTPITISATPVLRLYYQDGRIANLSACKIRSRAGA